MCSELDVDGLFIPMLEGAQDLALPLSEHVKVETQVSTQRWEANCDDSWLENRAAAGMV